jgi:hypothetical protein
MSARQQPWRASKSKFDAPGACTQHWVPPSGSVIQDAGRSISVTIIVKFTDAMRGRSQYGSSIFEFTLRHDSRRLQPLPHALYFTESERCFFAPLRILMDLSATKTVRDIAPKPQATAQAWDRKTWITMNIQKLLSIISELLAIESLYTIIYWLVIMLLSVIQLV